MIEDNNEVTIEEIMDKYMISSIKKTTTSWIKHILLNDGKNQYSGELSWDINTGYVWKSDSAHVPSELLRPEFEYILDCITEMDN